MPHSRPRYAAPIIAKLLSASPIVGVLGQRQTGKTTLVERIAAEYATLDSGALLRAANESPEAFIEGRKEPFTIDECQLAPPLFAALKDSVRRRPGPGRFLLTGSVRFTSRKAIRESLTGRILNVELLPMSWSECHGLPLSELPFKLASNPRAGLAYAAGRMKLKALSRAREHLALGGLPGICFQRSQALRERRYEIHVETLLERDLRLLLETRLSFTALRTLLAALAARQGSPLDVSDLSRSTRISRPTLMGLLRAFEGLFLIRTLRAEGGTARPLVFLEDQGMATHLFQGTHEPYVDALRLLTANIPHQFLYRLETSVTFSHYATRGGARVPWVARFGGKTIGYLPENDSLPSHGSLLSARSFLKSAPGALAIIAHQGEDIRQVGEGIFSLPLQACL